MKIFHKTILAVALCLINFASNAEPVNATASATGSSSALNFTATVSPTSNFIGNNSKLYLAVLLGNALYFYSDAAGFVEYVGGLAALASSNAAEPTSVRAISKSTETINFAGDATVAVGADIYIGYGTNFAELISGARIAKKYTIRNGQAPIPVLRSSYENKMAAGKVLGPQNMPQRWYGNARAYADFLQNGTYTAVVNTLEYNVALPISNAVAGHIYFLKQVNGQWIDITIQLLTDNTGCIHPRKAMVADLNGDGKPDVVFACHGYDAPPFPGEQQRVLLSQADGKYKNVLLPITAYAHGGSVADVNGNGYADIIYTDTSIRKQPFYLINNHNESYAEDASRMPQSTNKFTCFTNSTCEWSIYSLEFVDFNTDGKYDMWIGGSVHPTDANGFNNSINSELFYNPGNNIFTNVGPIVLPTSLNNGGAMDMIYNAGKLATVYINNSANGGVSIDFVNLNNMALSTPYTHTGSYYGGINWIDWVVLVNGNIVPMDASIVVSVPF